MTARRATTSAGPGSATPIRAARRRLVAAALLTGALSSGCGVPGPGQSQVQSTADVPYGLLRPEQTGTSATQPAEPSRGAVRGLVAFTDQDGRIRLVPRWVKVGPPVVVAQALLDQLALGPSAAEQRRGLQSTVVAGQHLTVVNVADGVVLINLRGELHDQGTDHLYQGVAQIVFSVTSTPPVNAVSLESDGRPIEAPVSDGSLTGAPLTRADYQALLPARS